MLGWSECVCCVMCGDCSMWCDVVCVVGGLCGWYVGDCIGIEFGLGCWYDGCWVYVMVCCDVWYVVVGCGWYWFVGCVVKLYVVDFVLIGGCYVCCFVLMDGFFVMLDIGVVF